MSEFTQAVINARFYFHKPEFTETYNEFKGNMMNNLEQLESKRDLMRGKIQVMMDQPVVDFDDWMQTHAAYGAILVQIEQLTNPCRYIREVQ